MLTSIRLLANLTLSPKFCLLLQDPNIGASDVIGLAGIWLRKSCMIYPEALLGAPVQSLSTKIANPRQIVCAFEM